MTIKDIARLSGVSVSTVSRVLNDHPDVSEEAKEKVLAVVQEYNYIPNTSARELGKTSSDNIGVVVRGLSNPFYTKISTEIGSGIEKAGYTMVMQQIAAGEDEIMTAAKMERDKKLQGLIFLGGNLDYTKKLKKRDIIRIVILVIIAAAIFVTGLLLNDMSNKNVFTIVAILFSLPVAKILTRLIIIFPSKQVESDEYDEVVGAAEKKGCEYKLFPSVVITSEKKVMYMDYIFIIKGVVIGLVRNKKTLDKNGLQYVQDYLKKGVNNYGSGYTVRMHKDSHKFLEDLKGIKEKDVSKSDEEGVIDYIDSLIVR
jgi:transcriptional regulator with XRE-family HTH domain